MSYNIQINLEKLLREKGKTRYKLAQETGIHYKTIDSYYKNKVKRYEADSLLKMCLALDCEVGELIVITKEK